ncbi:hypothetical protein M758_11G141700 [Ceratodon purpureus]|nr:hypothetical protein M758_11G141700 [Ceratodon purpureus]KAG0601835.1 hypothetical protein M758_11G141700 [Ceratodon purpureus]
MVVWCGGPDKGQDITVRLVRSVLSASIVNGRRQEDIQHSNGEEVVAVLKVHSTQLRRCSKYFETCLSARWREADVGSSEGARFELSLEVNADMDVESYVDCFSRMYSPFRKDFRDVEHTLELLRVASQIEYIELMGLISQYLSAIPWSDEDERRIRDYAASPDFSRNYVQDLITRLGLDVTGEEHKKMSEQLTKWGIVHALSSEPLNCSKFIEELLDGIQVGTVTKIILEVAKGKLRELEQIRLDDDHFPENYNEDFDVYVSGIAWILGILLNAGVAEELVTCLVPSETIPLYLYRHGADVRHEGLEMAKVVLQMYQEVVAGRLLLQTHDRVALIGIWHDLLEEYLPAKKYTQATKALFSTLPFKDQFGFLETQEDLFINFIDPRSLAMLVKKNSSAMEGKLDSNEGMSTAADVVGSDG